MLLIILAVVEGPVLTLVCGALIVRDLLPPVQTAALLVAGDLVGDVLHYGAGRWGGALLGRRLRGPRVMVTRARVAARGMWSVILGKWTHGLGGLVLVAAGLAAMNPGKFLVASVIGTVPKTGALLLAGGLAGGALTVLIGAVPLISLVLVGVAGLVLWRVLR